MTDVNIVVGITGDTSGGRVIKKSLDDISASSKGAVASTKQLENQVRATTSATNSLKSALSAMGVALGLVQSVKSADQFTVMEARLKSVARSTQEATRMMGELRRISNATGSEMATSLSILQRLSFVREEIKATNNDMIVFTETVTKLGVTSGALPEAMKAGLTQLGQALSSQYTRAEEFNSIMENIPAVGKAIADELGVTTGQMRQLVVEGKLLSSDVFAAVLNQTEKVRSEFEQFPKTAEQGGKQMVNSFEQVIAQANKATGATNAIGLALRSVGVGAKMIYNGLATTFDYLAASVQEAVNLMLTGINKAIQAINWAKSNAPAWMGVDRSQIDLFKTSDIGGAFSAANAARKEREDALFGDEFSSAITTEKRAISQEYAKIAGEIAKKGKENKEALKAQKEIQQQLTDAIKDSRSETEKLHDEIEAMEKLKPFAKTTEQSMAIAKNIQNAREELDKLRVEAELNSPVGKAFQSLASEIDDGFKDAFKSAFTESDGGFKALLNGWKNTFKNFLADLAYQAFARPIVISLVGAVGGAFGLSSGAIAAASSTGGTVGTTVGSSGFLGNLGSLYSGGKALFGNSLGSSGISGAINTFGSKFGFANVGSNFMGPLLPGQTAGLTLSSALGYGSIGGLGASLLGLGNKNMFVNAGASTLGSLAGGLLGGPIGAGLGGFVGSALGGLFGGGKPSDKAQGGTLDFASGALSTNGQTGKKFSQENANYRDAIFSTMSSVIATIKQYGGAVNGSANIVVGSRDGLRYNGQNFGNNSQAFTDKIFTDLQNSITGLDETFSQILGKVGTQNASALSDAFAFGQSYKDAINPNLAADQLATAIKTVNDNMQKLLETATNLGLPIEEYTKALEKQRDAAVGALKAQAAGFASLEDMTKTFKAFLDGQSLSNNSSLTPLEKLGLAQRNFDDLLKTAQGGDLTVTSDLLGAAATLVELGRGIYASSVSFVALESFVRSSVSEIARAAGVPGYAKGTNSASPGLAMVGEQGRELVRMNGGEQVYTAGQTAGIMALSGNVSGDIVRGNQQVAALMQENTEEARASRKETVKMRKVMERLLNYMKVAA
ncbi:tape measure protein [Dyadobacter jiangsuensis]|uniref:Tape measure domain-containing protein n=1 Tax=Dyadobacter jiangsuensis TaxID=1591085 RepID=A0A2P8FP26_9BACT|nr:tape measure protein [Dyadobacter jiangsuensis]PSL23478.1 tape measure domain-containing protein [Dyadobacter jiangsuensis]